MSNQYPINQAEELSTIYGKLRRGQTLNLDETTLLFQLDDAILYTSGEEEEEEEGVQDLDDYLQKNSSTYTHDVSDSDESHEDTHADESSAVKIRQEIPIQLQSHSNKTESFKKSHHSSELQSTSAVTPKQTRSRGRKKSAQEHNKSIKSANENCVTDTQIETATKSKPSLLVLQKTKNSRQIRKKSPQKGTKLVPKINRKTGKKSPLKCKTTKNSAKNKRQTANKSPPKCNPAVTESGDIESSQDSHVHSETTPSKRTLSGRTNSSPAKARKTNASEFSSPIEDSNYEESVVTLQLDADDETSIDMHDTLNDHSPQNESQNQIASEIDTLISDVENQSPKLRRTSISYSRPRLRMQVSDVSTSSNATSSTASISTPNFDDVQIGDESSDEETPYLVSPEVRQVRQELYTYSPIENYPGDRIVEPDFQEGWIRYDQDPGPDEIFPFTGDPGITFPVTNHSPAEYFDAFFEDSMWAKLAENTNKYVKLKKEKLLLHKERQQNDPIHSIGSGRTTDKNQSRLKFWHDTTADEMKIFVAHLIVFGLVKKPKIELYWSQDEVISTPFFGKYMSRNRFELLLWNIHVSDPNLINNPRGEDGHDPLILVRPFVDMMNRKFIRNYRPAKHLSVDESTCPFKGNVFFKTYNNSKPNRFHIKLYVLSEATTGYMSCFEVYTGEAKLEKELKAKNKAQGKQRTINKKQPANTTSNTGKDDVKKTTKIVLDLLQKSNLLDLGHHVYMDNYYNSPQLLNKLLEDKTHGAGTVKTNRKGLSEAVKRAGHHKGSCKKEDEHGLKPGEMCFRRNDKLLFLKWKDKRDVYILSSIHTANKATKIQRNFRGEQITKPVPVLEYNKYMFGVDLADQYLQYYQFLRKTVKWSKKFFIHCLNMVIINAFILHKNHAPNPVTQSVFRYAIVRHLLSTSNVTPRGVRTFADDSPSRLKDKHYIQLYPVQEGKKRCNRICHVCNFTKTSVQTDHPYLKLKRWTSYHCPDCKKALCIHPCFMIYHSEDDFRNKAISWFVANQMP